VVAAPLLLVALFPWRRPYIQRVKSVQTAVLQNYDVRNLAATLNVTVTLLAPAAAAGMFWHNRWIAMPSHPAPSDPQPRVDIGHRVRYATHVAVESFHPTTIRSVTDPLRSGIRNRDRRLRRL